MATLNALPAHESIESIEFPRLKTTDEATDGNLGAHLSTPNVLLATRDLFHAVLPANQGFERPSNHHLVMGARSI
jgi:hypothetical protein